MMEVAPLITSDHLVGLLVGAVVSLAGTVVALWRYIKSQAKAESTRRDKEDEFKKEMVEKLGTVGSNSTNAINNNNEILKEIKAQQKDHHDQVFAYIIKASKQ